MKDTMRLPIRLFAAIALVVLSTFPALAQDSRNMFHSIRAADGTWLPFGDVKAQAGNPGVMIDGSISGNPDTGELQAVAVTSDGGLWHTIRTADGTWLPFGDVKAEAGDPGLFCSVATTLIGDNLHLVGATLNGKLWHTIRAASGIWVPFGDVKAEAGDPGFFCSDPPGFPGNVNVSGNSATGELHLVGLTTDATTGLWHTIRSADGTWLPFGDVKAEAGLQGIPLASVGSGMIGGNLHIAVATGGVSHTLWHTVRAADGTWLPFADVEAEAGDVHQGFADVSVSGNQETGELQVIGSTFEGGLWHTIRAADGTWLPFGDVTAQAGNPGPLCGAPVAIDLIGPNLHVIVITSRCIFLKR